METRRRTMAKAVSWRVIATVITSGAALLVTGKMEFAFAIGALDTALKLAVYYAHERAWNRSEYGRMDAGHFGKGEGI